MGELVFCSAEQPRALPSPFVLVIDIIFPVALPKGDVASFQSAGDVVGARGTGYPGGTFVFQVAEQTCLVFLPFPVEVGDKLFDALPVSKDGEVEISSPVLAGFVPDGGKWHQRFQAVEAGRQSACLYRQAISSSGSQCGNYPACRYRCWPYGWCIP